jgi:hypothetical protein
MGMAVGTRCAGRPLLRAAQTRVCVCQYIHRGMPLFSWLTLRVCARPILKHNVHTLCAYIVCFVGLRIPLHLHANG